MLSLELILLFLELYKEYINTLYNKPLPLDKRNRLVLRLENTINTCLV